MDLFHVKAIHKNDKLVLEENKNKDSLSSKSQILTKNKNLSIDNTDERELVNSFSDLGLCPWICESAKAMGLRRPTPIQKHCIPAILSGKDVLACAETGSGKTGDFVIIIVVIAIIDILNILFVITTNKLFTIIMITVVI